MFLLTYITVFLFAWLYCLVCLTTASSTAFVMTELYNKYLWRETGQEPVLVQIRSRKWNLLLYTLGQGDECITSRH